MVHFVGVLEGGVIKQNKKQKKSKNKNKQREKKLKRKVKEQENESGKKKDLLWKYLFQSLVFHDFEVLIANVINEVMIF